jgi:hypothetical protein
MIGITSQDAPECRLRALINLGSATIRRGPDKKTHRWISIVKITGLIGFVRPPFFLMSEQKCNRRDWLSVISYRSAKKRNQNNSLKHKYLWAINPLEFWNE